MSFTQFISQFSFCLIGHRYKFGFVFMTLDWESPYKQYDLQNFIYKCVLDIESMLNNTNFVRFLVMRMDKNFLPFHE